MAAMKKDIEEKNEIKTEETPPKKRFLPKPIRMTLFFGGTALLAIAGGFGAGFLVHKMTDHPKVIEIDAATGRVRDFDIDYHGYFDFDD